MTEEISIRVVLQFEEEITDNIAGISEAMAHIPRSWSIADAEREVIGRLFTSHRAMDRSILFQTTVEGDREFLDSVLKLVNEKGNLTGKQILLSSGDIKLLHCKLAFAGEREAVIAEYSMWSSNMRIRRELEKNAAPVEADPNHKTESQEHHESMSSRP